VFLKEIIYLLSYLYILLHSTALVYSKKILIAMVSSCSTHSSSAQFQNNIYKVSVFEKSMKTYNMFMTDTSVKADFLRHFVFLMWFD